MSDGGSGASASVMPLPFPTPEFGPLFFPSVAASATTTSTTTPPLPLTLVSWNIGLRGLEGTISLFGNTLSGLLASLHNPDVLLLQETKLPNGRLPAKRELAVADGYSSFFSNSRSTLGRSGVAIVIKDSLRLPILTVEEGMTGGALFDAGVSMTGGGVIDRDLDSSGSSRSGSDGVIEKFTPLELDSEGRSLMIDIGPLIIACVYAPANAYGRGPFKAQYHQAISHRIRSLLSSRRHHILLLGDLNVSHRAIDVADPSSWAPDPTTFKSAPTRVWMNELLGFSSAAAAAASSSATTNTAAEETSSYLVDAFRHFHPVKNGAFTCWEEKSRARETNYGSRIDYALFDTHCNNEGGVGVGGADAPIIVGSDLWPNVMGSDHCPIVLRILLPFSSIQNARDTAPAAALHLPHVCSANAAPSYISRQLGIKDALLLATPSSSSTATSEKRPRPLDIPLPPSLSTITAPIIMSRRPVPKIDSFFVRNKGIITAKSSGGGGSGGGSGREISSTKRSSGGGGGSDVEVIEILSSQDEIEDSTISESIAGSGSASGTEGAGASTIDLKKKKVESFNALFASGGGTKRLQPRCKCLEISVVRRVRDGINEGLLFYVCSKPKGKTENGGACDFFQWVQK